MISTLGTSWSIVPELFAFTNPQQLDLYAHHESCAQIAAQRAEYGIVGVNRIWVVTTEKMRTDRLREWAARIEMPIDIWHPLGVDELASVRENRAMADLIYRVVLRGREVTRNGRLYLSLAGGRKTMSAEMQQAGMLFGCDALLHVVDRQLPSGIERLSDQDVGAFCAPLPKPYADIYQPLVTLGRCPPNAALEVHPSIRSADFPVPPAGGAVPPELPLYEEVRRRLRQADSLIYNFSCQVSQAEAQSNFHGLYMLPPDRVKALRATRLGADSARTQADLGWLAQLPKSDLHCHLGGVLDAAGLIEVATTSAAQVREREAVNPELARQLKQVRALAAAEDLDGLRALLGAATAQTPDFRQIRQWDTQEPWGVCGFLMAFTDRPALLDALVFDALRDPARYQGIGIAAYEPLGDLQGSALLQCEASLRAACAMVRRAARRDRLRYLELRCSPHNYTRGGLSAQQVVDILLDSLSDETDCDIRLLFIASRHRRMSEAIQHIELAQDLRAASADFRRRFVGFDLAGNEQQRSPVEMRDAFRPLLKACIPISIHAGEDQPVNNIWEATYELSAERIGHGLTLHDNPELLRRCVERRIAVEMCPSSNYQIVGFRDFVLQAGPDTQYPLADYLSAGLRVTVNTDNPGISRTDPSQELYKAAAMTPGGLTYWEVLQLIRNGFQAAFCNRQDRRELLGRAEAELMEWLTETASRDV
ncbi:adenosine deaminase [Thiorhodovibrio frisius]|uniref:adenosine deaminase n=1 Tax=Thiorhodovibrio frisius TaxID=631362 RepID=H8Z1Y5_9GAMM|nr:adenosine deaminase [Thiorhodovibrio frisius]WPL24094.1 Adenine deaminase [Thiorhodovibrio frisius]